MRPPALALVLTVLNLLAAVFPVNADPMPIHAHLLRAATTNATSSETSSSTSSASSSSSLSSTTSSSSSISTSSPSIPPTSTSSSSSSSSQSSSSSLSTSSQPPTSIPASSSSQDTPSSTQSTQIALSSTSSFVTSDITTSTSSDTQTPTQTRTTFTSTRSDGTLFTVTAVVSSPSGGSGSSIVNTPRQGFFANTGAVAGTFLVVGLVGTGFFICVFLWAWRRYRRRKRYLEYFDYEDKEFNRPRERGGTPEATLPDVSRDSPLDTPASSSPTPNMIERLHGNEAAIPNGSYDPSLHHPQSGEFDPYRNLGGPYAYSDDQAVYGQYPGNSQPDNIAYAYQPGTEFNGNPEQHQAVAEPSHAP